MNMNNYDFILIMFQLGRATFVDEDFTDFCRLLRAYVIENNVLNFNKIIDFIEDFI